MKTSAVIKSLAIAVTLAGSSIFLGGCATGGVDLLAPPDASSAENGQRNLRYADYDRAQIIDDFDRDVTMSRPEGPLTHFNLVHHD